MKRKTVSFIITLLICVALCSLVLSAVNLYYEMPMNATIEEVASVGFYIDNSAWTNNTDVGWGTLAPGDSDTKNFTVENTGNIACQIIMYVTGLPSGWDLTYSRNGSTVMAGNWLNGTLTLTTASTSGSASYYWTASINVS